MLDIYTDGASRGNPGLSAIAFVIRSDDALELFSKSIGHHTNNEAEYIAILEALKRAREKGIYNVKVFSDSELIVKQILGIYKIKSQNLKHLNEEVKMMLNMFKHYEIKNIPRENKYIKIADKICNILLDHLG